jgi:predicted phosphoadenosine phosphosulfate sulfurtransferase
MLTVVDVKLISWGEFDAETMWVNPLPLQVKILKRNCFCFKMNTIAR